MKASATIAVISEQRSQMLGAYEDAMAAPRLTGSFKVKICGSLRGSWTTHEGRCFSASGALQVLKRRQDRSHGNLPQTLVVAAIVDDGSMSARSAGTVAPVTSGTSSEAMSHGGDNCA